MVELATRARDLAGSFGQSALQRYPQQGQRRPSQAWRLLERPGADADAGADVDEVLEEWTAELDSDLAAAADIEDLYARPWDEVQTGPFPPWERATDDLSLDQYYDGLRHVVLDDGQELDKETTERFIDAWDHWFEDSHEAKTALSSEKIMLTQTEGTYGLEVDRLRKLTDNIMRTLTESAGGSDVGRLGKLDVRQINKLLSFSADFFTADSPARASIFEAHYTLMQKLSGGMLESSPQDREAAETTLSVIYDHSFLQLAKELAMEAQKLETSNLELKALLKGLRKETSLNTLMTKLLKAFLFSRRGFLTEQAALEDFEEARGTQPLNALELVQNVLEAIPSPEALARTVERVKGKMELGLVLKTLSKILTCAAVYLYFPRMTTLDVQEEAAKFLMGALAELRRKLPASSRRPAAKPTPAEARVESRIGAGERLLRSALEKIEKAKETRDQQQSQEQVKIESLRTLLLSLANLAMARTALLATVATVSAAAAIPGLGALWQSLASTATASPYTERGRSRLPPQRASSIRGRTPPPRVKDAEEALRKEERLRNQEAAAKAAWEARSAARRQQMEQAQAQRDAERSRKEEAAREHSEVMARMQPRASKLGIYREDPLRRARS